MLQFILFHYYLNYILANSFNVQVHFLKIFQNTARICTEFNKRQLLLIVTIATVAIYDLYYNIVTRVYIIKVAFAVS